MLKFAVLFAVFFVCTHAKAFPYYGRNYNNWPANLDTPDDNQQQAGQGYPNVAAQGANEPGDTPDDDQVAAAGGQGAAPQSGTTMAPVSAGGDSSSSSSSEEEGSVAGGVGPTGATGTVGPSAGPIQGAGRNQAAGQAGQGAGQDAGQSSGNVENAVGGPVQAQPQAGNTGDTSQQVADAGVPSPLNMKPQAVKAQESRKASTAVALTTVGLVAGVAATSIVAYKYKDAIKARMGL